MKMKYTLSAVILSALLTVPAFAGPHGKPCGREHHRDCGSRSGVRLAADIINLTASALNLVSAVSRPAAAVPPRPAAVPPPPPPPPQPHHHHGRCR